MNVMSKWNPNEFAIRLAKKNRQDAINKLLKLNFIDENIDEIREELKKYHEAYTQLQNLT